jgi:hypothetical protein
LAVAERAQVNNHGGWYRQVRDELNLLPLLASSLSTHTHTHFAFYPCATQVASGIALHVGDQDFAQTLFNEIAADYIGKVMSPAGYLPFDVCIHREVMLKRTRGKHRGFLSNRLVLYNRRFALDPGITTFTGCCRGLARHRSRRALGGRPLLTMSGLRAKRSDAVWKCHICTPGVH